MTKDARVTNESPDHAEVVLEAISGDQWESDEAPPEAVQVRPPDDEPPEAEQARPDDEESLPELEEEFLLADPDDDEDEPKSSS